jgi:hypothetical protein
LGGVPPRCGPPSSSSTSFEKKVHDSLLPGIRDSRGPQNRQTTAGATTHTPDAPPSAAAKP